jgi:hypothetical protein
MARQREVQACRLLCYEEWMTVLDSLQRAGHGMRESSIDPDITDSTAGTGWRGNMLESEHQTPSLCI